MPRSASLSRPTGAPGAPTRRLTTALVLALTAAVAIDASRSPRSERLAAPAVSSAALAPALPAPSTPAGAVAANAAAPTATAAPELVAAPQPTAAPPPPAAPAAPLVPTATVPPAAAGPVASGSAAGWSDPAALAGGMVPAVPAAPGQTSLAVPGSAALLAASDNVVGQPAARVAAMAETVAMGGLLPANRILTYYGHPHDENMGILGEYEKEELLRLLLEEAANYEAADPSTPVIPAFEVIATVAQNWPTDTGHYLLDTDMKTLQEYADFAEANGILLFLDLQIGRNTVPAEIAKVMPLLERPHVHLALDPEFAIAEGQVPGTHIGELTAAQIGEAQAILSRLVLERNLPPKILIVHQFVEDMILGKQELAPMPGVQVVIEADGFGRPSLKKEVYRILIENDRYEYSGIKHFYRQDTPVMTAAETLALDPSPILVIYQ